jgi:glycosyltransferase involved in cell wall biosynthesis
MRIAMLAPPWIPVPPPGYGGIEAMIALLCDGLVARGHDVTLLAPPGSSSAAEIRTLLPNVHDDAIEKARYEADHVARAFELIDLGAPSGGPYDVVHDHCGFTAFAMADRIGVPMVHTLHGPFTPDTSEFYERHARKAHVVALSRHQRAAAPPSLRIGGVIPNPIDVGDWPYREAKDDYVLWLGRMTSVKGPQRAIAASRAAGARLVLAGPVQAGQEEFFAREVEPHIDDDWVRYVGEVGGQEKKRLLAGARALLMPIRWAEPFGIVMVEAMACGTPVIAFGEGAATDIVRDGVTGFLVDDEEAMAQALHDGRRIDPAACRSHVSARYAVDAVAAAYSAVYANASHSSPRRRHAFAARAARAS